MLPFLVAALLATTALVSGHHVIVLLVGLVLLLLRFRDERERKRQRAIDALLRTVGSKPEGVVFRPGRTCLVATDLCPRDKQWELIRSVPDLLMVQDRPGGPGHRPLEAVGCLVRLTENGRIAFRKALAARGMPRARARYSA